MAFNKNLHSYLEFVFLQKNFLFCTIIIIFRNAQNSESDTIGHVEILQIFNTILTITWDVYPFLKFYYRMNFLCIWSSKFQIVTAGALSLQFLHQLLRCLQRWKDLQSHDSWHPCLASDFKGTAFQSYLLSTVLWYNLYQVKEIPSYSWSTKSIFFSDK